MRPERPVWTFNTILYLNLQQKKKKSLPFPVKKRQAYLWKNRVPILLPHQNKMCDQRVDVEVLHNEDVAALDVLRGADVTELGVNLIRNLSASAASHVLWPAVGASISVWRWSWAIKRVGWALDWGKRPTPRLP